MYSPSTEIIMAEMTFRYWYRNALDGLALVPMIEACRNPDPKIGSIITIPLVRP